MRWTADVQRAHGVRNPIRVLVVDDHVVVRRGIRALLATEAGIEVVGEAGDGREAVAEAESLRPDMILMDLLMPEMDGIEATRRIIARQPEVRILVLTSFASDDMVFPAIKAGALGYLLKDSSPEELVGAIHQVNRGEPSLHPTIAEKVLQELSRPSEQGIAPEPLTEQETKVLQLVARGRSNREIADGLRVSEAAVRIHVNDILTKLHLASRTQAVLYALREGLASLDDLSPKYVSRLLAMVGKPADSVSPAVDERPPGMAPPGRPSSARELETLRLIAADHRKVGQELALAGEIQASFLPGVVPDVPGWQVTATLEPARETAGDFYDFIPLPNGRLGMLVADVADKGMGAALYMALSRTLIRTYAAEHDRRPELLLSAVNDRILMDTRASLFVTVFYGILDPISGTLTYCNAGHNPPYLLSAKDGGSAQELGRTGIPLGIEEDVTWQQGAVPLAPGDVLVLYTDGITEAQDRHQDFFGEERLLEIAQANLERSAGYIQDVLIAEVHRFVDDAPQSDDITLMVVVRDS
jgi:DNA-binding NarL/FixJ family response regulator/serine phosphatase RsbU (regulator of sigma subunit)